MNKLAQFVLRDFRMEVAYKVKLVSDLFYVVFTVVLYFYLSRLIGGSSPLLERYGCDYFSFVMVGVALANYLSAALQGYNENVRRFMVEGSLEAMFASPTPHHLLILYSSVWPIVYALLKTALQFLVAYVGFGFVPRRMDLWSTALSLLLSTLMFSAIGMISASLLIVVKRGDPFNWLFIQLSHIFGGVLFPIEMLPPWGSLLSWLFPIRYALDATRRAMLTAASPRELWPELLILLAFVALLVPLGWYISVHLINHAKRSGTISLF